MQQPPFKVASYPLQKNILAIAQISVESRNPSSHPQLINLWPEA